MISPDELARPKRFHEYFRVDDAILWDIITKDAHALKTVMDASR